MESNHSLFSMKDKVALVTGASGYLGIQICTCLAEAGALVLLNGRDDKKIDGLYNEMKNEGLAVEKAVFDITDAGAVKEYFEKYNHDSLDVLVNNAYVGSGGTISVSEEESYRNSYEISIISTHVLIKNALPYLKKGVKKHGSVSVINMGSMYGMVSPDITIYEHESGANPPFYGAAKAALIQWTRYAACEFGSQGIRFNTISPGAFPSKEVQTSQPEFIIKLNQKVPMGRVGLASELMGPILFLASNASSYVNGTNLVVDGGWTAW